MKAALFLSAIITAATGLTENSNHMPESIPAMMTGCPSLNLPSTLSTRRTRAPIYHTFGGLGTYT